MLPAYTPSVCGPSSGRKPQAMAQARLLQRVDPTAQQSAQPTHEFERATHHANPFLSAALNASAINTNSKNTIRIELTSPPLSIFID